MRLREIRESQNLTQKQMAEKLDIGLWTYNRYERGKQKASVIVLIAIASVLNVDVDDIEIDARLK